MFEEGKETSSSLTADNLKAHLPFSLLSGFASKHLTAHRHAVYEQASYQGNWVAKNERSAAFIQEGAFIVGPCGISYSTVQAVSSGGQLLPSWGGALLFLVTVSTPSCCERVTAVLPPQILNI